MRLIDYFDRGAAMYPERDAFHDGERGYSFADVEIRTHRIANALMAAGIGKDRKAAVYSHNHVLAFEAVLGILRAGGVWVTQNVRNAIADSIAFLQDTETELLFYHSDHAGVAAQIREECPNIRTFICLDKPDGEAPSLEAFIEGQPERAPWVDCRPDDLALLVNTGGTTGRPKGVMLTNMAMETSIANMLAFTHYDEPPVHLIAAPMTHAAGLISFCFLAHGGTQVVMPGVDVEKLMQNIERFKVTTLFLPPTVIYMMLAHPDVKKYDYSSLKHFIYAAAPMSADKLREALDVFGPVMFQTYGQAEAPMVCTIMTPHQHVEAVRTNKMKRLESCGQPTPFTDLAIMDDEGNLMPAGEAGEIVVRGNLVMAGYYKNEEATEEVSKFGWHHTGDIGVMDEDRFVYIVDRKKDMIISGGFNVFPSEVERLLLAQPGVQDCAVIGVPHEKWGEAVKAVVERTPGGPEVSEEELIALCKKELGGVKAPKSVDFIDALPRSPVGKVLKRDLRDTYWEGQSRKV